MILYRRLRETMPAYELEVEEALHEELSFMSWYHLFVLWPADAERLKR